VRRLIGRRTLRSEARRFVIEGPVLIAEAVAAGIEVGPVLVERALIDRVPDACEVALCDDGQLAKVLDAATPQPMAATAPFFGHTLDDHLNASFVVVADRIADPGNLGTILRTAEAAGADLVVTTPGTVDRYSPKVVRSAAGALFHIPVVDASLDDLPPTWRLLATSSHADLAYDQVDLRSQVSVVVGNEAHGLDDEALSRCDELVAIPHLGRSESLNVAMAATVLAFEVARQRRNRAS
jgi:RNA methyltransferase, TrmH family